MTKMEIMKLVFDALEMINQTRADDRQIPINDTTALYGANGYLDSMDLVSLLIDIEEALLDRDIEVSLSDDKAMSAANSPFKDLESIVQFIQKAIQVSE